MTRLEIHIERLVLRGVPDEFASGLGPAVESRLARLAAADGPAGAGRRRSPIADRDALAATVADRIWSALRDGGIG